MDNPRPTITIKLRPYLREYLICRLGDPVVAKRSFVATLIKPFLEVRPKEIGPCFKKGDDYVTIELPFYRHLGSYQSNNTVYVSEENQLEVERILHAHFWDTFYSYMDDKVRYVMTKTTNKGSIKRCIIQFCSDFDISYNYINYEMFKKAYYRRRKIHTLISNAKRNKSGLTCPLDFLI